MILVIGLFSNEKGLNCEKRTRDSPSLHSPQQYGALFSYLGVLSRDLPEEVQCVAGVVRTREERVVLLLEEKRKIVGEAPQQQ